MKNNSSIYNRSKALRKTDSIIEYIQNGVEVDLKTTGDQWGNEIRIKVSEIPSEVDLIIVKLS